jgi:hypothetical protein
MYTNGSKLRLELTVDGTPMIKLIDREAGTQTMLMVEDRMYMVMPAAMVPFRAPTIQALSAANPCSQSGLTGCVSLGEDQVNGYPDTGWRYTIDGEEQNSWIATSLGVPVRTVGADGSTFDYSNFSLDPLEASLFEIPANYQPMPSMPFG